MTLAEYFRGEGRREGEAREAHAQKMIAANMLSEGVDLHLIVKVTGLTLEEIHSLESIA